MTTVRRALRPTTYKGSKQTVNAQLCQTARKRFIPCRSTWPLPAQLARLRPDWRRSARHLLTRSDCVRGRREWGRSGRWPALGQSPLMTASGSSRGRVRCFRRLARQSLSASPGKDFFAPGSCLVLFSFPYPPRSNEKAPCSNTGPACSSGCSASSRRLFYRKAIFTCFSRDLSRGRKRAVQPLVSAAAGGRGRAPYRSTGAPAILFARVRPAAMLLE